MLQLSKFRHYVSDCWHSTEDLTNLAEATNNMGSNSTLLLVHDDSSDQKDVWYLNSGASNHMCGKKELFMELAEGVHGSVSLGDSSKLLIEARGKIKIYQKDDKPEYILSLIHI